MNEKDGDGCMGCVHVVEERGRMAWEKVLFRCFAPGTHTGRCVSCGYLPTIRPKWCGGKVNTYAGDRDDRK